MFTSISCVIIDDIVLADGTRFTECLGGGGIHGAMGMRVWSDQVGLVAKIGDDFPADLMETLERSFDVKGLAICKMKTVRSSQIFDGDGTRRNIFFPKLDNLDPLKPDINSFPDEYDHLEGIHLHSDGDVLHRWIPFLRQRGDPFILWEPWQRFCIAENRMQLPKILPLIDCVSPNLEEARFLLEIEDIDDLLNEFLSFGAKKVVIRAGADGSYYADTEGNMIRVPAVKVDRVVDHTGAGNAYCGGLAVGFVTSEDIQDALCKAAVSASFPLEQFGAIFSLENITRRAETRFKTCRTDMRKLNKKFY